jgi:hypothetical protein
MPQSEGDTRVNLKVHRDTRERVNEAKERGQSQEDVINQLLDERERRDSIRQIVRSEMEAVISDYLSGR